MQCLSVYMLYLLWVLTGNPSWNIRRKFFMYASFLKTFWLYLLIFTSIFLSSRSTSSVPDKEQSCFEACILKRSMFCSPIEYIVDEAWYQHNIILQSVILTTLTTFTMSKGYPPLVTWFIHKLHSINLHYSSFLISELFSIASYT